MFRRSDEPDHCTSAHMSALLAHFNAGCEVLDHACASLAIERERIRIGGIGRSRRVGRRGVMVQGDPLIARSKKGRRHSMFAARNWFWTFDNQVDSSARPKRSHNAFLRVAARTPQPLFEQSARGRRFWFCVSASLVSEYGQGMGRWRALQ
jgi:hypothetical protein